MASELSAFEPLLSHLQTTLAHTKDLRLSLKDMEGKIFPKPNFRNTEFLVYAPSFVGLP